VERKEFFFFESGDIIFDMQPHSKVTQIYYLF